MIESVEIENIHTKKLCQVSLDYDMLHIGAWSSQKNWIDSVKWEAVDNSETKNSWWTDLDRHCAVQFIIAKDNTHGLCHRGSSFYGNVKIRHATPSFKLKARVENEMNPLFTIMRTPLSRTHFKEIPSLTHHSRYSNFVQWKVVTKPTWENFSF